MRFNLLIVMSLLLFSGCASTPSTTKNGEPSHITVQHCLIAFDGSLPGKSISRTQEEARVLAEKLFEDAKNGEDFNGIVLSNTDDEPPGLYNMANHGFRGKNTRDMNKKVFARGEMVPAFGDVGFKLEIGDYGMSEYSKDKSPFGWHIIKRIK